MFGSVRGFLLYIIVYHVISLLHRRIPIESIPITTDEECAEFLHQLMREKVKDQINLFLLHEIQ